MKGKSRAEMGLLEFTETQLRSAVTGIRVTITESLIAGDRRTKEMNVHGWKRQQ